MGDLTPLTALEIHAGMVLDPVTPPEAVLGPPAGTPREVLETLLLEALAEGECHVMFSGGRDSSVMLAAATDVARRHGLPDPIPLTARFAAHPSTWETEWQERTIAHLGLREWNRFEVAGELDALGPIATGALERHGLYWPPNAHTMLLFAGRAGRGAVLTGGGGDELFSPWGYRRIPLDTLRTLRPRRRVAKWAAWSALPLAARQALLHRRRPPVALPWLQPAANARLAALERAERPSRTWREELRRYLASRYLEVVQRTLRTFAADAGTRLVEPFYDLRLARAVAAIAPPGGFGDRGDALEALFSDLLPRDVLRRSTKATFTGALWGPRAGAFAAAWDGTGLDTTLVDPVALRRAWAAETPDGRTATMLQHLWLRGRADQPRDASSSS
jgi:asparagine synthetase B (glutamine-hydrolysing)